MESCLKLVFCLAIFAGVGAASANLVTNGSFEQGTFSPPSNNTMSLAVGSTNITGWSVDSMSLAWIADPNPFNGLHASNGIKSLDLTEFRNGSGSYSGVSQSIPTIPGTWYQVRFDIGTHANYTNFTCIQAIAASYSQVFTVMSSTGQTWRPCVFDFQATSGSTTLHLNGFAQTFSYIGLDNVSAEATIAPLNGHVDLQDYFGFIDSRSVTVDISNGSDAQEWSGILDANGNFQAPLTVPAGTYTVGVKCSHWLRKSVSNVTMTASGPNSVSVSLINGDVDGDNEVAIGDYSRLSAAFNSDPSLPNWNAEADLNGDDGVDIGDYAILSSHYGMFGD